MLANKKDKGATDAIDKLANFLMHLGDSAMNQSECGLAGTHDHQSHYSARSRFFAP